MLYIALSVILGGLAGYLNFATAYPPRWAGAGTLAWIVLVAGGAAVWVQPELPKVATVPMLAAGVFILIDAQRTTASRQDHATP